MGILNFLKKDESNTIEPIQIEKNIKLDYYSRKLNIYFKMVDNMVNEQVNIIKIKTTLTTCFNDLINNYEKINLRINNKKELLKLINEFLVNKKYKNQDIIINFIENDFIFKFMNENELNEEINIENKLKKLRGIIYNNYCFINENNENKDFSWMFFCYKNKLTKQRIFQGELVRSIEKIKNQPKDI